MFQSNHGIALLKEGSIHNMANKRLVDNIKTRWKLSRHRFEEKKHCISRVVHYECDQHRNYSLVNVKLE